MLEEAIEEGDVKPEELPAEIVIQLLRRQLAREKRKPPDGPDLLRAGQVSLAPHLLNDGEVTSR